MSARPRRGRAARCAAAVVGSGLTGAVALAVAGPAGAVLPAQAAVAVADERPAVALSVDGQQWSRSLGVPLLDAERVWVPGDVERASLLVRNDGPSRARGNVSVTLDGDPELVQALEVRLRTDGGRRHDGGSAPLALGRGAVQPIELEVAFDPDSGNATQGTTAHLGVSVVLEGDPVVDDEEPPPGDEAPDGAAGGADPGGVSGREASGSSPDAGPPDAVTSRGPLPRTGGDTARLLALAVAALVGGAVLRSIRRDRGGARA
ncbi:hypothetical protein GCM10009718_24940 [Isoptericola halotolerans]|uniref:Gram-positive cocci surface proteins LPxTG domain-containing protein n=1 Tax=Isoptericola halotolerans TaxID=300560 RepID=A0ABX2A5K6_9MICO|nr:hypothetical protein [Isoptericola halotolerans]NOV97941.1 hypothetical protein [Isoptericola halotolerans]